MSLHHMQLLNAVIFDTNIKSFNILVMSKYTAFRCPDDLLAKAKVKALKDRRSLSNYIITLIEADVKGEPTPKQPVKKARKR